MRLEREAEAERRRTACKCERGPHRIIFLGLGDQLAAQRPFSRMLKATMFGDSGFHGVEALSLMQDEFFPDSPRVLYAKAPLKQVFCQLRFPTILKIESNVPSEFQQQIRGILPLFERVEPLGTVFQIPQQMAEAFGRGLGAPAYRFLTEDRTTSVELSSSALSYQTNAYRLWDDLLAKLTPCIAALEKIYEPSFYNRVGLRYLDVIDRHEIGLNDVPWSSLLKGAILGELSEAFIEKNIEAIQKVVRVRNPDQKGGFLLQHGIPETSQGVSKVYSIDFDFYVDTKTEMKDVAAVLDDLHSRAGRAWRWCITPRLHDALDPHEL